MAKESDTTTTFHSDKPIQTHDQDIFGRKPHVKFITDYIRGSSTSDPIIVAINSPWGSGKTSFLNLVEEELKKHSDTRCPIIVRFNPWFFKDTEQVLEQFFRQISISIKAKSLKDRAGSVADLLDASSTLLSQGSKSLGTLLKLATRAVKKILVESTIEDVKNKLNKAFEDLDRRVVILIDDIDRLEKENIRVIFRLVRLNADFPNTTYILAFDRKVVESQLDKVDGTTGRDFVEKIVQVVFDLPLPEREQINKLLFTELDKVLSDIKVRSFDQERWARLWAEGLIYQFKTLRNVKRYANSIRMSFSCIGGEVDPVDLLGIEYLRIFHPTLYQAVSESKEYLAPSVPSQVQRRILSDGVTGDDPFSKFKKYVKHDWTRVRSVLGTLFPFMTSQYTTDYDKASRNRRVCSHEDFETYFCLSVPTSEVSEIEMSEFFDSCSSLEKSRAIVRRFSEKGKIKSYLRHLGMYVSESPKELVQPIIELLFDVGDSIKVRSESIYDLPVGWYIRGIVTGLLLRLDSDEERAHVLTQSVRGTKGLFTPIQAVSVTRPSNPDGDKVLSEESIWSPLKDEAVGLIRKAAISGELWDSENMLYLLHRWLEWTDQEEVRIGVNEYIKGNDDNLVKVLGAFKATGGPEIVDRDGKHIMGIDLEKLSVFLEPKKALKRLMNMDMSGIFNNEVENLIKMLEMA